MSFSRRHSGKHVVISRCHRYRWLIERWTAEVVLKSRCMHARVALEASLLAVRAAAEMPLRMRASDSRTTTLHVHQGNTEAWWVKIWESKIKLPIFDVTVMNMFKRHLKDNSYSITPSLFRICPIYYANYPIQSWQDFLLNCLSG